MDISLELRNNLGEKLLVNEPLKDHTNFKIGGPAKYFFTAATADELVKAYQVARELKIPVIILGGGTNVLVSDQGFAGLVIKVKNQDYKIDGLKVVSDAGVNLGFLVQKTVAVGLSGFEPLVGVPGSVGGAVYGNAGLPGAVQGFIGDWVKAVTVFRENKVVRVPAAECQFAYRDSLFKYNSDIILSAEFELMAGDKAASQELVKKYISARQNQPYHLPSSGCVFTNVPIVDASEIKQKFPQEEKLEQFIARGQLPASWLIDQAGLKGKTMGGIQISGQHANYLVNVGGARAEDVVMMISYIKQQVRDKFGIQLQEEVRYLGF
ncbi:MAG: UDP-N-acetylmuramate dehydrogenase [Candidatus Kerfeldbacteria bacterium]|nr:UDP-N-acetylmuramate dehydrogenase [Candidatus Kerfeldbacteria bacterium]